MTIYYQGKDITRYVQVRKCIARDTCGERCDSIEIEFENAAGWYRWQPEEDDQIIVAQDGYNTGIMYLNTILPESDKYRIVATSLPCAARKKEYRSFTGKTIEEIMRICAVRTGMDCELYGVKSKTIIPYIMQEDESAGAFLRRLLLWEGAQLKCLNGTYIAIGTEYAQSLKAVQTIAISAETKGTEYRRGNKRYRMANVRTPFASAVAEDSLFTKGDMVLLLDLPARDSIQAARWARGVLMDVNRRNEELVLNTTFNPAMTAMTRIDITGGTDASGEWLVQEAEHDFINKTTRVKLHRCIRTIL